MSEREKALNVTGLTGMWLIISAASQRGWWLQIQTACPPSALCLPFKPLFFLMYSLWAMAGYNPHDESPSFQELYSLLYGMPCSNIWGLFLLNMTEGFFVCVCVCSTWKSLSCEMIFLQLDHLPGVFFWQKYRKYFFQTTWHNFISRVTSSQSPSPTSSFCSCRISDIWWCVFNTPGYCSNVVQFWKVDERRESALETVCVSCSTIRKKKKKENTFNFRWSSDLGLKPLLFLERLS